MRTLRCPMLICAGLNAENKTVSLGKFGGFGLALAKTRRIKLAVPLFFTAALINIEMSAI